MTPKQIEELMAALWALVERPIRRDGAPSVREELHRLMAQADPTGIHKSDAPTSGESSPDVSLRDCPRLSKLIGEPDNLTHD